MKNTLFALLLLSLPCCGADPNAESATLANTNADSAYPDFVNWDVPRGQFLGITGDIQILNVSGASEIRNQNCLTVSNTGQCSGLVKGPFAFGEFCDGSDLAVRLAIIKDFDKSITVAPQAGSGSCVNGVPKKN